MKIAVASGKGGTGKTLVSVSLFLSIKDKFKKTVFADLDVEEPNAHLFLKPQIEQEVLINLPYPEVDNQKCDFCGLCMEYCNYSAISVFKETKRVLVLRNLCKGCGLCAEVCPQKAIKEKERIVGRVRVAEGFLEGRMEVGETVASYVVKHVKKHMKGYDVAIMDLQPGATCPVVEGLRDADFAVLVTEPTSFGFHDLKIAVELTQKLGVNCGVIINKQGIGDEREILSFLQEKKIPVLLKIPFSRQIAVAYSKGTPLVEAFPEWKEKFLEVFDKIWKLSS